MKDDSPDAEPTEVLSRAKVLQAALADTVIRADPGGLGDLPLVDDPTEPTVPTPAIADDELPVGSPTELRDAAAALEEATVIRPTPPPAPPPARAPRPQRAASLPPPLSVSAAPHFDVPMVVMSASRYRWFRILMAINGVVLATMFAALVYTVPRSLAFEDVLAENLAVKERLQGLDEKMREVDRLLLRLRLYDAQLRSLSEPKGDHGPVETEGDLRGVVDFANVGSDGAVLEEYTSGPDAGLRSPADWAGGVHARADSFLSRMEELEPNLTELVVELEDLRSLEASLPKLWPSTGFLSSGYGWRRDPMARNWRFHSGLDIANTAGTPIFAAADGVVSRAEMTPGYGRIVEIEHGYGITTLYAHCQRLHVKAGDRVRAGQRIARIGTSGKSTGPHLHYEVRLDGNAMDPMDYVPRGTQPEP